MTFLWKSSIMQLFFKNAGGERDKNLLGYKGKSLVAATGCEKSNGLGEQSRISVCGKWMFGEASVPQTVDLLPSYFSNGNVRFSRWKWFRWNSSRSWHGRVCGWLCWVGEACLMEAAGQIRRWSMTGLDSLVMSQRSNRIKSVFAEHCSLEVKCWSSLC